MGRRGGDGVIAGRFPSVYYRNTNKSIWVIICFICIRNKAEH